MADRPVRIITKQTAVPGRVPTGTTGYEDNLIRQGEMAQNTYDKKLFGFDGSAIFEYGSNSFIGLTGGTISGNLKVTGSLSAGTIYSAGTDLYNIFLTTNDGNDITRVQPGSNITTGGTGNQPTINLVASPSINNLTLSGTGNANAFSATTFSAGTINSGTTNIQNYFNVINSQLGTKANLSGATFTGNVLAPSLSATTLSGGTILSGSTDLYNIFLTTNDGNDITRVQPGSNITTGGTGNQPTINLVASPSVNGLTVSGTGNFTGTLQSGGTDLNNIFVQGSGTSGTIPLWTATRTQGNSVITQAGTGVTINGSIYIYGNVDILGTASTFNTQTVQTADNNITMNLSGSHVSAYGGGITVLSGIPNNTPSTWTIDINGTWSANTGIISSALTVNNGNINVLGGGKLQSGSTDLYNIFLTTNDGNDITRVQPGSNITTGGTGNNPTINLVASPSINGLTLSGTGNANAFSATTLSGGTILSGITDIYTIFAKPNLVVNNVNAGSNITTGGTAISPTINLIPSPSINNLTVSGTSNNNALSATTFSAGTINSGTTELSTVMQNLINSSAWLLSGNTNGVEKYIGTNDNFALPFNVNGIEAMRITNEGSTANRIFINSSSSIGGSNAGIQYSNAAVANRAQIKLHSYFTGTSVAGVSTLTSRSGTIGVNNAVVNGQEYSKWTAQAGATTVGSAPIAGTWAFIANNVNSLTVTSDWRVQLTNSAGTLGDRFYLTSEGVLNVYNDILPNVTGAYNLGSDTKKFKDAYLSGGLTSNTISAITINAGTILSAGTDLYNIFLTTNDGNDITRVQPGSNITTGGTGNQPTINLNASPSINNLTLSGTGNANAFSATTLSAGTINSGTTDIYTIFAKPNLVVNNVNAGSNIVSGGTAISPTINLNASPSINNLTLSGTGNANAFSATTLSAGTIFSAGTDLYNIFITTNDGNDITRVQPGSNITTGGTGNQPTINLVASPSVNGFTASGGTNLKGVTATTLTSTTISGASLFIQGSARLTDDIGLLSNPDLVIDSIYNQRVLLTDNNTLNTWYLHTQAFVGGEGYGNFGIGVSSNNVNNFITITTGGTFIHKSNLATGFTITNTTGGTPIFRADSVNKRVGINVVQARESLEVSGKTLMQQLTATTISSTTISASTINSGTTNLYQIFQAIGTDIDTTVQPGSNITTGGTALVPIVSLVASPSINNLTVSGTSNNNALSATTFSAGTIFSATTDIYTIFAKPNLVVNNVNAGSNITTGGTAISPIINLTASPSVNQFTTSGAVIINSTLTVTGNTTLKATTATTFSATTISGGTIYSGSTNLESIFVNKNSFLTQKAGSVTGSTFAGNPKKASVVFTVPFSDINYSISISSDTNRTFTWESKAASGFTINANANPAFASGNVNWIAIKHGDSAS